MVQGTRKVLYNKISQYTVQYCQLLTKFSPERHAVCDFHAHFTVKYGIATVTRKFKNNVLYLHYSSGVKSLDCGYQSQSVSNASPRLEGSVLYILYLPSIKQSCF